MVAMLLLLAACQTIQTGATSEGPRFYCQLADPITYSRKDTGQTKRQIIAHNGEYASVCDQEERRK